MTPLTKDEVARMRATANAPSHVKPIALMAADGVTVILCDAYEELREENARLQQQIIGTAWVRQTEEG